MTPTLRVAKKLERGGEAKKSTATMEVIQTQLNALNYFFSTRPKATLIVGKNHHGIWLIADDDLEVITFTVVRYMLKNNLKEIGNIKIHNNGDNENYILYAKSSYTL